MKFNNKNVFISKSAKIGSNVRIGDNTSIYDNVIVHDNTQICNNCIIGEPLSEYYNNDEYINPVTEIGEDSLIRSHSIIYAGSKFGKKLTTGHRVTIREYTEMGSNCRIGTVSDIQGYAVFGNHCWLHSNVHIGQKSTIGSFVFIYPYVVLTNDPTPPSDICVGPTIGNFSQIAVFSTILPGIKIGEHCLIGAGSVVGKDVGDYILAMGSPAKAVKDVREIKSREDGSSHYPWPYRFDRGMPWQGMEFEKWMNKDE